MTIFYIVIETKTIINTIKKCLETLLNMHEQVRDVLHGHYLLD
jgi:hypothetical protein